MSKKIKISVLIHKRVDDELMQLMISTGYGIKKKSTWICEAIESLLNIEGFPSIIQYEGLAGLTKMIVFSAPFELKQRLEEAIIKVRSKHPSLEGVQSKIIRAAIMQRIMCNK